MRMLAAVLLLLGGPAGSNESRELIMPGGVTVQVKTDEMTDVKQCCVFTRMRGVQVGVCGQQDVVVWTSDKLAVAPTPEPMMRIGEEPAFVLSVPSRPHLIAVPEGKRAGLIDALYAGREVKIRFSEWPSGDQKNFVVTTPYFAAGYDRATAECGWAARNVPAAPLAREPRVYNGENGYVSASFGDDSWVVMSSPRSCSLSSGHTPDVYSVLGGAPSQVLPLGKMMVRKASGEVVGEVRHDGFAVGPLAELIALAEKAGEYGTVDLRFETRSLFGFREAVDYAKKTCGWQLKPAAPPAP